MARFNDDEKEALDELVKQFEALFPGATWTQSDILRQALNALYCETFHEDIATVVRRKKGKTS